MIEFLLWREKGKSHRLKINNEKHFLHIRISESVQGTAKPQQGVRHRDTHARRDPLAEALPCRTQRVDLSVLYHAEFVNPTALTRYSPLTHVVSPLGCSHAPYTVLGIWLSKKAAIKLAMRKYLGK